MRSHVSHEFMLSDITWVASWIERGKKNRWPKVHDFMVAKIGAQALMT